MSADQRPYGESARDLEMQRERRLSAMTSAPAQPSGPPPQAVGGENPGPPMSFKSDLQFGEGDQNPPPPSDPGGPSLDWPKDIRDRTTRQDQDPFAQFSGVKDVLSRAGDFAGQALRGAVEAPIVGGLLQAVGWAYGETVDPLLGLVETGDPAAQAAYEKYRMTLQGDQASALDYFATTRGLRAAHQVAQEDAARIANDPRQPAIIRAMAGAQNVADVVAQNVIPVPGVAEAGGALAGAAKGALKGAAGAVKEAARPGTEVFASSGAREEGIQAAAAAKAEAAKAAAEKAKEVGAPDPQLAALDDTQLKVLSETASDEGARKYASAELERRAAAQAAQEADAANAAAANLERSGRPKDAQIAREAAIRSGKAAPSDVVPGAPVVFDAKDKARPRGVMDVSGIQKPAPYTPGVPVTMTPAFQSFLDRLPQGIRGDVEGSVQKNISVVEQQRRGRQSIAAINARAKQVGLDMRRIAQVAPGTAATPEEMRAVLDGYVKATERRKGLAATIREAGTFASDADKARFVVASYEENLLQRVALGYRAEIGRGMRILREFHDGENAGKFQDTYSRVLKEIGGAQNADELMGRLYDIELDPNLTAMEKKFKQAKLMEGLSQANFWDKVNENFINAILSNPATHVANAAGQTALHEMDVLSQVPAAAWDAVASKLTGRGRERTFSGAIAGAVMGHHSLDRATREALLYLKDGISEEQITHFEMGGVSPMRGHAIGGKLGTVINVPTRALGAEDVFFYRNGYQRQLGQDAANAVATRKGAPPITSRAFWDEVGAIMDSPPPEMLAKAREAGKRAGLRQDAGAVSDALMTLRDLKVPPNFPVVGGLRPGGFIAPFIRISFNLARVGAEYSPLGYLRMVPKKIGGVATAGERADAFGRATMGTALWTLFWQKKDLGELTGAAPNDPSERAAFYNSGKQPYSVKIGDQWHRFDRLEPIATPLRWVAGIHDAATELKNDPLNYGLYASTLMKAMGVVGQSLASSNFVNDISTFLDIIKAPGDTGSEKMAKYAGHLAGSMIPFSGFMRGLSMTQDPISRNPKGQDLQSIIVQQIESGIPGLSQRLDPYLTNWGDPEQRPKQGPTAMFDIAPGTKDVGVDPVDAEIARHSIPAGVDANGAPLPVKQLFAGLARTDSGKYKLAQDEGFMLQQVSGRAAHQALTDLFSGKRSYQGKPYASLDEPTKVKAIQKTIADARATGRAVVADAMIHSGDPAKENRGAAMRVLLAPTIRERAETIGGLSASGKLTAAARRLISSDLAKDGPTLDEYVKAAPFVSRYLSVRPFVRGDAAEWDRLKEQRSEYAKARAKDPQAPMPPLVRQYQGAENPERERLLSTNPNMRRFVAGATYDWQP